MKATTMKVLIATEDHSYREALVRHIKVVHNPAQRQYYEYHGDEYLEPGDLVVEMAVAE